MESKDLRFFLEVTKTNSISKAADNLYTSQSNVTAHIKKIENELNINLFTRHNKGVTLTTDGEKLLVYSQNIISLLDEANNLFSNQNSFNIATTQTISLSLPKYIKILQEKYPNTSISIRILNDIDSKQKNQLDCIITNSSKKNLLNYKKLEFDEQLVIIAPKTCTTINDLVNYNLIVSSLPTCPYKKILFDYFVHTTKILKNVIELDSVTAIINSVELESGIALIPLRLLKKDLEINKFFIDNLQKSTITIWTKQNTSSFGNDLVKLLKKEQLI